MAAQNCSLGGALSAASLQQSSLHPSDEAGSRLLHLQNSLFLGLCVDSKDHRVLTAFQARAGWSGDGGPEQCSM